MCSKSVLLYCTVVEENVSPELIGAPALWDDLGGPGLAGEGIKIGIIDSGIDLSNPFLTDAGYPATDQTDACAPLTKPDNSNTSNKVIVCRVYASGVAAPADGELIVFDHGTHVAGTAAGNNDTDGPVAVGEDTTVTIENMSGVAPFAFLGDYNVFPGFGAGFVAFGGSAFSHEPTGTVTVDGTAAQEFSTENEDIIAGFSSRGPTPFNYLIKPDVTAPGVNVVSSVFDGEFAFFQGTSMATPHLAGGAQSSGLFHLYRLIRDGSTTTS